MYFLIFLMIVGLGVLGGVFCMTLIGAAPWSRKKTRSPTQFLGKTLSPQELAIGTNHIVLGSLWLALWGYSLALKFDPFAVEFAPSTFEVVLQFVTSVVLFISGIAVIVQSARWRRFYTFGVLSIVGTSADRKN